VQERGQNLAESRKNKLLGDASDIANPKFGLRMLHEQGFQSGMIRSETCKVEFSYNG